MTCLALVSLVHCFVAHPILGLANLDDLDDVRVDDVPLSLFANQLGDPWLILQKYARETRESLSRYFVFLTYSSLFSTNGNLHAYLFMSLNSIFLRLIL